MKQNPPSQLQLLKLYYLFILILTAILVVPTHIFSPPLFMPFRFPHYLEMMKPFLDISWPLSFEIYHLILLILAIIGAVNVLGIVFYPKWKVLARISSFAGLFLTLSMFLFFLFPFMRTNPPTAIIYGIYSLLLFIVNLLTFITLTKK